MSLIHSKEEALRIVQQMSDGMFADGLLLDVPKRRRREQAQGKRPMTINMPADQKRRLGTQINRYIEIFGKEAGIEMILHLIEHPTNEHLSSLADEQHVMGKDLINAE